MRVMRVSAAAPVPPLRLDVTEPARDLIADSIAWVRGLPLPFGGEEAAARFSLALDRELPDLCQDIAERFASGNNLPRPDEEASLNYARPAFRHTFTVAGGKRKKRQTAGVWFLFYTLPGGNVLRVMGLRHSASEPLTADFDLPFDAGEETDE